MRVAPLKDRGELFSTEFRSFIFEGDLVFPAAEDLSPGGLITVKSHPRSLAAVEGEDVSFRVTAEGNALRYQWQFSQDNGVTWSPCGAGYTGFDTDALRLTALTRRDGFLYRCRFVNGAGTVEYSLPAMLTVSPAAFGFTEQPKNVWAVENADASFTAAAQGYGLKYRWQYLDKNGEWKYSGVEGATLTVTADARHNGATYRCEISNAAGEKLYSDPATLTVLKDALPAPGDVTGDGAVTAEDARMALRAAVGLEVLEENSPPFIAADADRDGALSAADARLILRAAVGLETLS